MQEITRLISSPRSGGFFMSLNNFNNPLGLSDFLEFVDG